MVRRDDMNNYLQIKQTIPEQVSLVAVSKNQSIDDIQSLVDLGVTNLGENKLQEIIRKKEYFPQVNWHFIGRIQSNKIAKIVQHSVLIHSVSELRYLNLINDHARNQNKVQDVLLQINLANELTKAGLKEEELNWLTKNYKTYQHVRICGLMIIGDNVKDHQQIKETFDNGYNLYNHLKCQIEDFSILSMGMSNDYKLAIEAGSNMVRLGTILFQY